MKNTIQDKSKLVNSVFSKVYKKYDLMNDVMSLGIHRIWKEKYINWLNPSPNSNLVDVASGTGDIAKLFSNRIDHSAKITCVEPNNEMFDEGKKNLEKYKNVRWKVSNAEKLSVPDNSYDFYTISFGLRNTKNIDKSLKEAYRVLKKGGKFMCLEFSKIENNNLDIFYKNYSKLIPKIGEIVVGQKKPYEYLVKSIENFLSQRQLIEKMEKNNFVRCKYRNLSGGIVSIHSGWKI